MDGNPAGDRSRMSVADAANLLFDRSQTPPEDKSEAPESEVEAVEAETEEVEYDEPESEEDDGEEYDASDESEDDEYEDDSDEETDVYTVKVDGEEHEVTLDELLNGYSRTQDYTKKTQSLAEQRKQFEAERQKVKQLEQNYAQRLEQLAKQTATSQEQEPDWNQLYNEDPIGYVKAKADWDAKQAERQRIQAEHQEMQRRQYAERMQEAQKRLPELIPEWASEERAKAEKPKVVNWALANGFQQDELANATDPRAVAVMRKAMLYDELMSKKPATEKKVRKAPKATKGGQPKSKAQSQQKRLREKASQIGKSKGHTAINAAADYLVARGKSR